MAKWGEGDPRWIVEERADATNVNNWHWTEKNATAWSKEKLTSLLSNLVIDDEKHFCEIKDITKIEGEASANNRKSKLFFFYEWEIKAEWKGKVKTEDVSYKGVVEIPNLSEEHNPDDVDINVTLNDGQDGGYAIKEFLRTKGVQTIRVQLGQYIKQLKQEFSQGMILPRKDGPVSNDSGPKTAENGVKGKEKHVLNQPVQSADLVCGGVGLKIKCKTLKDEEEFKCSVSDLYRTLTDRDMIRIFTTDEAMVDSSKGGRFSLFGGNVLGEFVELVPDKKIVMRWRFKSWPAKHYSTVNIELHQKDDCTILKLSQTEIPIGEFDKTREGWKNHYWRSIKQRFGFGACLF
jgi:activator of HSP90 ATPase